MNIIIENYNDLLDQFGDGTLNGLKSTKDIIQEVKNQVMINNVLKHIAVECNRKSDAICIFTLLDNHKNTFIYEYNGTAN